MASRFSHSDLVEDLQLDGRFYDEYTIDVRYEYRSKGREKVRVETTWTKTEKLGEGTYGVVWLEKTRRNEVRALKRVVKRGNLDYHRELSAMATLRKHDNLFVSFQGWYNDKDAIYIAMEYFALGDLKKYLEDYGHCQEEDAKVITRQLLEGLAKMHEMGFTHRDLKPANIFVKQGRPTWWIKLGDFGISKRARPDATSPSPLLTRAGSRGFLAPEIQYGEEYTNIVDMWSLGCIAYWLCTQKTPFPMFEDFAKFCGDGTFPIRSLHERQVSKEGIQFLRDTIVLSPSQRLSAAAGLHHSWVKVVSEQLKLDDRPVDEDPSRRPSSTPSPPPNSPLPPLIAATGPPKMRESGRQPRRQSPPRGEGRSQDGPSPPRREFQEQPQIERAPTASKMDNQWRENMRPDHLDKPHSPPLNSVSPTNQHQPPSRLDPTEATTVLYPDQMPSPKFSKGITSSQPPPSLSPATEPPTVFSRNTAPPRRRNPTRELQDVSTREVELLPIPTPPREPETVPVPEVPSSPESQHPRPTVDPQTVPTPELSSSPQPPKPSPIGDVQEVPTPEVILPSRTNRTRGSRSRHTGEASISTHSTRTRHQQAVPSVVDQQPQSNSPMTPQSSPRIDIQIDRPAKDPDSGKCC